MKRTAGVLIAIMALSVPIFAETRVSVTAELLNTVASGAQLEDWTFLPTGSAELALRNQGSRRVRSELVLRYLPVGEGVLASLERLYARASFGEVLVTVGKTRSSWGAGLALNAGDIIFGSSSTDFSLQATDPRSQTSWLVSSELPLGDFSFAEIIVLPGVPDISNPFAPKAPALNDAAAGTRVSLALGDITMQSGYIFRGHEIAGLGTTGHHGFLSVEGYVPVTWHLSAATRTPRDRWDANALSDDLVVTAGANGDISLPADRTLAWQLEALVRPFGAFESSPGAEASEYGLFLYPGISFLPRTGLTISLASLVSPIDLSANSLFSISWNIYESLTLLSYTSIASGEETDLFSIEKPGGVSFTIGARYVY